MEKYFSSREQEAVRSAREAAKALGAGGVGPAPRCDVFSMRKAAARPPLFLIIYAAS